MYNMSRFQNRERRKQILLSEIAERVSQRLDESLILEDFYKSLVEEHGFDTESAQYIVEDVQAISEAMGTDIKKMVQDILGKIRSVPAAKKGVLIASLMGALAGGASAQSGGDTSTVAPITRTEMSDLNKIPDSRLEQLVRSYEAPVGMFISPAGQNITNGTYDDMLEKYLNFWRNDDGTFDEEFKPEDSRHFSQLHGRTNREYAMKYFRAAYNEYLKALKSGQPLPGKSGRTYTGAY